MGGKRTSKNCWATVQPRNTTVLKEKVDGECKICKEPIKNLDDIQSHQLKKHGSGGGSVLGWKEKKPEEKAEGSSTGEKKSEQKKTQKKKKTGKDKKKEKGTKGKEKEDKPKGKKKARKGKKKN